MGKRIKGEPGMGRGLDRRGTAYRRRRSKLLLRRGRKGPAVAGVVGGTEV